MKTTSTSLERFKKLMWSYYKKHKRDLPWRKTRNPYHILVSEIMLQQTQVSRVLQKYPLLLAHFPTIQSLDKASLKNILTLWQGMGYNRRALYLKRIAHTIVKNHEGTIPNDLHALQQLPGIGKATAGSIVAFSFNAPTVFIETNIRRVFIYFFFPKKREIDDKDIKPIVEKVLDRENPREWYYALMDYGSMLSKKIPNPNRNSKHYIKQSSFIGSNRQIRGMILTQLLNSKSVNKSPLTSKNLKALKKEGMVMEKDGVYFIE